MIPLVFALATQSRPVHPTKPTVTVTQAAVTAREAKESIGRLSALIVKVTGAPLGGSRVPAEERAVTRAEVVAEMARIYRASAIAFRFVPSPVAFDASKFRMDSAELSNLKDLVRHGCIGRLSPLAVGPGANMTPKQFGDALGFFASRLMQMSHLPDPVFTPSLQDG